MHNFGRVIASALIYSKIIGIVFGCNVYYAVLYRSYSRHVRSLRGYGSTCTSSKNLVVTLAVWNHRKIWIKQHCAATSCKILAV